MRQGLHVNWNKELAAARSADEVVAIANDYFAAARVGLADRLPPDALPASIVDVTALHAAQRKAVDLFMSNPVHALDPGMQDLCGFAIRALARALEVSEHDVSGAPRREATYRASSFDDRVEL